MTLRSRLLTFLRVPAAPSAPAGDDDVRIFRAAPNYFRYRVARWALGNLGGFFGIIAGVVFLRSIPERYAQSGLMLIFTIIEIGAVLLFLIQAIWTLALLRLDFEQRWYLVSDRSLRIREGLVRMHEKTMTYANIQHVTIEQGPLQRILGIADVQVRTAGGGGGGGAGGHKDGHGMGDDMHVAYFRGVSNAEGISETIRERLRRHADAGLGDPDDVHAALPNTSQTTDTSLLDAARALEHEALALRRSLTSE